jgi:YD repeat-containing protein
MKKLLLATALALVATGAMAQQSEYRARYYYHGEPHIGPATAGTMYDGQGRNVGRSYTDSQGSTTIYGNDGRVMGRTATDSQGTTTFYDAGGRVTGKAVPERR